MTSDRLDVVPHLFQEGALMGTNDRYIKYIKFGVADMARAKAFYGAAFG